MLFILLVMLVVAGGMVVDVELDRAEHVVTSDPATATTWWCLNRHCQSVCSCHHVADPEYAATTATPTPTSTLLSVTHADARIT